MKRLLNYRTFLFALCSGLFTFQASAQSTSVHIINNSSCYVFLEYVEAYDCETSTVCFAYPDENCIPPGITVTLSPCGTSTYEWAIGAIAMADEDCQQCGNRIEVQREVECYSTANPVNFPACGSCPGAIAQWVAPDVIEIN